MEENSTTQIEVLQTAEQLYQVARSIVIEEQRASVALLQRKLKIGYARGARLIDMLEEAGVVGKENGAKPREVLAKTKDFVDLPITPREEIENTGEAPRPEVITEEYPRVIVNEDFSFIGKDGKTYTLQPKQKLFADFYLDFGGDRIEAIIEAGYDVNYKNNKGEDTGVPNRKLCSVMAYEFLTYPHISSYINARMAEMGFNKENVEEQHLFLLNQHADLKTKAKAVDMYYKVKGRYPKEPKTVNNLNVFSLADLADKSTKRKQMGLPPVEAEVIENQEVEPQKVHPAFDNKPLQSRNENVTDS